MKNEVLKSIEEWLISHLKYPLFYTDLLAIDNAINESVLPLTELEIEDESAIDLRQNDTEYVLEFNFYTHTNDTAIVIIRCNKETKEKTYSIELMFEDEYYEYNKQSDFIDGIMYFLYK